MPSILDELAEHARERVKIAEAEHPFEEVMDRALLAMALTPRRNKDFPFENSLRIKSAEGMAFICECKRASPSEGMIAEDFQYVKIAQEYESAGAAAVSVLTEPKWFKGDNEYLREIAQNISAPCLRKDFTVSPYMVAEAKVLGASAVLLICSLLDAKELKHCISLANEIGISALVEAHDEDEVRMALDAGARVVGVNNRNLKDFTVDINNSVRLRKLVPNDVLFVSESGIKTPEDVKMLHDAGINAVLVGTSLMREPNKRRALKRLGGAL